MNLLKPQWYNYDEEYVCIIPFENYKAGSKVDLHPGSERAYLKERKIGPASNPWTTAAIQIVETTRSHPPVLISGDIADKAMKEFKSNGNTAIRSNKKLASKRKKKEKTDLSAIINAVKAKKENK